MQNPDNKTSTFRDKKSFQGKSRAQISYKNSAAGLKRTVSAREIALDILIRIFTQQSYSHLVLSHFLSNHQLSHVDQRLVTEIVYGTCNRLNTIDYYLQQFMPKPIEKLNLWVKILLEISAYQFIYLDRIPEHAIVYEAVKIAKSRGHQGISKLVNGVLRNLIRMRDQLIIPEDLPISHKLSIQYSHPEWLVNKWMGELGQTSTIKTCEANLNYPKASIRINQMKTNRDEMINKFRLIGISANKSELSHEGIIVHDEGLLVKQLEYEQGYYTIQDECSMIVSEILQPLPHMKVLDCCAAPGGKLTHIAEMMHDQGEVWACDIHNHKKKLIENQVNRLGLKSINFLIDDARNLNKRFPKEYFDRILLDAPCSGLGVIRKKPDIKWNKKPQEIDSMAKLQFELLSQVSQLLKPGGILVYSTCTISRQENEQNIHRFLKEHPTYSLDALPSVVNEKIKSMITCNQPGIIQILPYHFQTDGFFMARLVKR